MTWPSALVQQIFVKNLGLLIVWAYTNGFALTLGRGHTTLQENVVEGGIPVSLHPRGLAQDLNLFIDGVYQRDSAAHKPLGEYWKSLHPLNRWGGDFKPKQDGNHYSMEHEGIK